MVSQKFITQNALQTQKLAERIGRKIRLSAAHVPRQKALILALYGELGSGKTTFIQGLARGLGIKKRILSPSFVLIRHYTQGLKPRNFYHVDLYRLDSAKEAEGLGLEEIWSDPENICAIEWAEKIENLLPKKRIDIFFNYLDQDKREVSLFKVRPCTRTDLVGRKNNLRNELSSKAIGILKRGGIVVFPTDTAFGVGCRIDDEEAVERLFKIRRRPQDQAVPVLVDSIEMAQKYLQPIPKEVLKLMEKYWPGALTLILPCKLELVPEVVRGAGRTLGIRWSDHPTAQSLIKEVGVPILGPSANFSGAKTPYKYEDLDPEFLKKVDFVLPGKCPLGMASTVIDCSKKPWKIIRQGALRPPLADSG